MTRNTTISDCGRYAIAWGKDHACGWFIQVFDLEDPHEPENMIVDKDQLFDGIGPREVIEIADTYHARDRVEREMFGF